MNEFSNVNLYIKYASLFKAGNVVFLAFNTDCSHKMFLFGRAHCSQQCDSLVIKADWAVWGIGSSVDVHRF